MRIVISGHSDDIICISGDVEHEFEFDEDGTILNIGGRLRVHCIYDGCWAFAPGKVGEEIDIPDSWKIDIVEYDENKYSMGLIISTGQEKVNIFKEK